MIAFILYTCVDVPVVYSQQHEQDQKIKPEKKPLLSEQEKNAFIR